MGVQRSFISGLFSREKETVRRKDDFSNLHRRTGKKKQNTLCLRFREVKESRDRRITRAGFSFVTTKHLTGNSPATEGSHCGIFSDPTTTSLKERI